MKLLKSLRNEKGVSTLLVVMSVAGILAVFILTLQMYVTSRARTVARIRLAYKYTFVMEDAAKIAVLSRIEFFQGCVAGRSGKVIANEPSGTPNTIQICMSNAQDSNRCINGSACLCEIQANETDAQCADNVWLDDKFWKKPNLLNEEGDELIAINHENNDPDLSPAFDRSIFETLIPNFDNKFVAFVQRVFNRDSSNRNLSGFFHEAVADANVSYNFTIPNPSVFAGTPTADTASITSPYPTAAAFPNGQAFTFRDCGEGRCVEIRVCVREANEPSIRSGDGQVCFKQKISRSFLWPHSAAPCAAPLDATGQACNNPANRDLPVYPTPVPPGVADKGHSGCTGCPWRNRF